MNKRRLSISSTNLAGLAGLVQVDIEPKNSAKLLEAFHLINTSKTGVANTSELLAFFQVREIYESHAH